VVARGDAVLIGLPGFMALYVGASTAVYSGFHPGFVGTFLLVLGIVLLVLAIALYAVAEPSPWTPHSKGRQPWVTLACPVYGTPLAWVDEVGQWYCPQCRAYHGPAQT
jgi:hypothetical protein